MVKKKRTKITIGSISSSRILIVVVVMILGGSYGAYRLGHSQALTTGACNTAVLGVGTNGRCVGSLQGLLNYYVYNSDVNRYSMAITNHFDTKTQSFVKLFQISRHIHADGVVGPTTWKYLCQGLSIKYPTAAQIEGGRRGDLYRISVGCNVLVEHH